MDQNQNNEQFEHSVQPEQMPVKSTPRQVPVSSAVVMCVFAVILACMVTAFAYTASYDLKVYQLNKDYNTAVQAMTEAYEAKLAAIDEQLKNYGEIAADLREIDELYRAAFPGEIDENAIRNYAIKGYVAGTGDRYGFYYSPEEAEALMNEVNGETDGIGISVIYDAERGSIEVIQVVSDSPAEKAGILVGDCIAYVIDNDGTEKAVAEIGYDVALNILRGKAGTEAKFTGFRDSDGDGVYTEHDFSIERAHVDALSVSYHVYEPDNTIGVIQITGFDKKTPGQFYAAVDELKKSGVEKLIFDVRNNPGGDKDAVCDVLDYLLPEGPLFRTVNAAGEYTVDVESDKRFLDMPMAVVMNSATASAGELFAAAIKDYDAGKLVGTTTYGKGSMQTITPVFDDGSLLRLTVALYCPPTSDNYDGVGIAPDIEVELDEALKDKNFYKYTDAEDNQLRAAAESFK